MRKLLIGLAAIGGVVLLLFLYLNSSYNRAVALDEETKARWSDVGSAYQRRADLIPNLMETVKGAAANERGILTAVTEARAGIVNAKTPEDFEVLGKKINTAINLAFEAYPQIRSTENFQQLQAQLEGTENRINVARENYNESVQRYNSHIRGFVTRIALSVAGGNFEAKKGFESKAGADEAPKVKF
jgi:LemA protein